MTAAVAADRAVVNEPVGYEPVVRVVYEPVVYEPMVYR